jgi:CheY-like chemotaxis protein
MELDNRPFLLRSCIEESMAIVAASACAKGIYTSLAIDPFVPEAIVGDNARLRQILVNLLSNAVKFTERGEVSIHVSSECGEGPINMIHFAVKDTGIGIPAEKMNQLFQSFSQVDASNTRKFGGTGLGLVISRKLVELMKGKIWAESQFGQGSTFHFAILASPAPRDLAKKAASPPKVHFSRGLDSGLSILLAEDNLVNQKVTLRMLEKLGFRADVAANGLEALQAMQQRPYDVILMDVQMPVMDGLEATREIRKRWPQGPKIIAMTASALEGDREMCLCAGMDCYIAKPAKIENLIKALEFCCAERKRMG